MYTPFPSQQRLIDKITEFLNSKSTKKGVYVAPVAFGKSIVIANVALNFPNKYFINIAPNKELIRQNYEKYISYGFEASLCSASLSSNEISKVTFATIGTLKKHVDFFRDKEVIIFQDECHNSSLKSSEVGKFFNKIKNCKLIGTTATPMRLHGALDGTKLKMLNRQRDCIYTSLEDVIQVSDVIAENRWSPLIYEVEDVDETDLRLNTTGTDYTLSSLAKFTEANNILEKCVKSVEMLREQGRKSCIVYVSTIDDAVKVSSNLLSCKALHSKVKPKQRDEIIENFTTGKLQTIVNVGILTQGFDYPELSSIVLARPTNSYGLYYQILGRGVRKHKNKKNAKIIDISGNYKKFGGIEELEFVNEEYTGGWAAFSGDKLLTGYALGSTVVPTKQSLQEAYEEEMQKQSKIENPVFTFGKYKGQSVRYVSNRHEGYLAWMISPKTAFDYNSQKNGHAIKRAIYKALKLPLNTL